MSVFQVFEHETVLVGDVRNGVSFEQKHFMGLCERLGKKDDSSFPFYSIVKYRQKEGIKFRQYVGAIQVGNLTIEILPKTDRETVGQDWKSVLLFMLSRVHNLSISSESNTPQRLRSSTILDFFILRFLNETERIIHQGLIKTYRNQAENLKSLKGTLLFPEQISKNYVHKERFFVRHMVYDRSHTMNRILRMALSCIYDYTTNTAFRQRAAAYLASFPELDSIVVDEKLFSRLTYDRKTEGYKDAISLAELILFNNMPNLSSGRKDTFAMLFDMNRLWEEFVYLTLRKYLFGQYSVNAQVKKRFWENKIIKPDIVVRDLSDSKKVFILDTKWKRPDGYYPADVDLHQMYVYYRFFGALKVALLYPSSDTVKPILNGYFSDDSHASCDMIFLPVPKWNGNGKQWQQEIANTVKNWF